MANCNKENRMKNIRTEFRTANGTKKRELRIYNTRYLIQCIQRVYSHCARAVALAGTNVLCLVHIYRQSHYFSHQHFRLLHI